MIQGYVNGRSPFVSVRLVLPRLGSTTYLEFLLDTGATTSVVHPIDAGRLGINFASDFARASTFTAAGIGGYSTEYIEPCDLYLAHHDGRIERLAVQLSFARPTQYNLQFPSLLGIDVIGLYKLTYHLSENLVSLE